MNRDLPVIVRIFFVIIALAIVSSLHPSKIYADFGFVKHSQPIFSPVSSNWDTQHVHNPHIIIENGLYKMWYEGNGGLGWRIGYAESTDGISFPSRSTSPILTTTTPTGEEHDMSDPFVLRLETNIYKLWWTSSFTGSSTFSTRLANFDGTTWTKYPTAVLTGTAGKWDSGGTLRGKSVIFDGTTYHMWYAGVDASNMWHSWRIGYATSPDGVIWTKQNGGEPVVTKTEDWEYSNVSYPYVLLRDGVYHMWYATGPEDLPDDIVYAYSFDGIHWTKPANMNPVITRSPGTFDQNHTASPYILIDGDQLKMWYSGYNGTTWRIGYATAPLSALPTLKKVVILPGLGGSWNNEAIWNCTLDPNVGTWSLTNLVLSGHKIVSDPYQPLADEIAGKGRTPYIFPYDWRQKIDVTAPKLAEFIQNNLNIAPGERTDIVGHSLGGLLARSYFQTYGSSGYIDRLITVGTPHGGSPLAYPAWSGGDIWWNNMAQRIGLTTVIKFCSIMKMKSDREIIQTMVPSVGQILPRDTFLTNYDDNTPKDAIHATNTLSLQPLTSPLFGTTLQAIYGTGVETTNSILVKDPKSHEIKIGNWLDGKPFRTTTNTEGDGTVLAKDAQIGGIDSISVATDHFGLVTSILGKNAIFSALGLPQSLTQSLSSQEPTTALVFLSLPGGFSTVDPDEQTIQDRNGFIGYLNPKKGTYRVQLQSTDSSRRFVVAQFLPNGKTLWKEYNFNDIKNKKGAISFDPDNPIEDAMQ